MEYYVYPGAFLERAQKLLDAFDEGHEPSLFYAALELRYGIEAHLHRCLQASLREIGQPKERIKEYTAKDLLNILVEVNPASSEQARIRFTSASGAQIDLNYEPITRTVVEQYGRLGGMLHYNFFENNPDWHREGSSTDSSKFHTLADYRRFLAGVCTELERLASCRFICAPQGLLKLLKGEGPEGASGS